MCRPISHATPRYNSPHIEAAIVIGMTYLVFWLGETIMYTSAVLSVVVMGFYLNNYKACLTPEVAEFLHTFYGMVVFLLNTIIFAIAGGKLGLLLADSSYHPILLQYAGEVPISHVPLSHHVRYT
jgi:hypothetical protein